MPATSADADESGAPAADAARVMVAVANPAVVDDVAALAENIGADVAAEITTSSTVTMTATDTEIDQLEATGAVVAVTPDIPLTTSLADSAPLVGATTTTAAGYDGAGRAVVVIDSGVQTDHEFFGGRVIDGACFSQSSSCPNDATTEDGVVAGAPCDFNDACFHGTHVAGIIAGRNDDMQGIAPGASILSVMVGSAVDCDDEDGCDLVFWTSDLLNALQQVIDWSAEYDIAAVNMSLGGGWFGGTNCDSYIGSLYMKPVITSLRAEGIATVIASGNEEYGDGIAFPACISNAVAVGATTKADEVAWYTNSSPAIDVWAPGSNIASAVTGGLYESASGTSMATPHVAGAFAVVDQLLPSATLATKEYRITKTGKYVTDPLNDIKRRRLKLSTDITPPNTTITQKPNATITGTKATFKFSGGSGATFECKINTGSWKSCTSPKVLSPAKGSHTFQVRARDAAGNLDATPAKYVFRRR